MNLRKLIKELRHKLRRDQDNLALRIELADLYRDDGNHAEALQIYREVAVSSWRAARLDEAQVACRRALDLAPHDRELGALLGDITRAQREARDAAMGRDALPQRRAQVWQTPSVGSEPLQAEPRGQADGAAGGAANLASAEAGHGHGSSPRTPAPGMGTTGMPPERPSQLMDAPTPLPEPLALHDAAEDSLMAQQPMRIRASITGLVPRIALPSELASSDDDVLAIAGPSGPHRSDGTPEHVSQRAHAGAAPDASSGAAAGMAHRPSQHSGHVSDDMADDDDDMDTDIRQLLARAVPQASEDRVSEDLTAPIMRLTTEPRPMRNAVVADDRPVFVSGEIALDDEPGSGRDTHPSLGGDEESIDELTWIKDLPDLPTTSAMTIPRVDVDTGSGVVQVALTPTDLLDETHPVDLVPRGQEQRATAMMDAEAVDEDKILAEEAVAEQPRSRRRSVPRTIMDLAPPVPSAAASLAARKAALSSVFSSFPGHVIEDLAEQVALRNFADAEYVFREGEPGRACFLVASGEVRVLRRDPVVEGQGLVEVARLSRGALFGERALLADRSRHGAAQAAGHCSLYEIPRRALRELAAVHHALGPLLEVFYREHLATMLIETAPFLGALPRTWRDALRARFRPVRRASGETILRQGERTGGLYIVVLGSVEITQRPSVRRARLLATLSEGMYFGDMSRLDAQSVVGATVSAAGPVELAMLPAEELDAIVAERPMLWAEICERGERRELERSNLLTGQTSLL
jgi:CRP-like cAMP-binding protein